MAEEEEIQELERQMKEVAAAMTTTDVARALASLQRVDFGHSLSRRSDMTLRQAALVCNKLNGDYEALLTTWNTWCSKKGLVDIPEEGEFGSKWLDDQDPSLRIGVAKEKFLVYVEKYPHAAWGSEPIDLTFMGREGLRSTVHPDNPDRRIPAGAEVVSGVKTGQGNILPRDEIVSLTSGRPRLDSLAQSLIGSQRTGRSEMTMGRVTTMAAGRMEEAERILKEVALIDPETMVGGSLELMRVRLDRCVHLAGRTGS